MYLGAFDYLLEIRIQTTKMNMYLPGEFYVGAPIGLLHS
jgi:hypothetical protein